MSDRTTFGQPDLISIVVTCEDVESCDPSSTLDLLRAFLASPEQARARRGTLDLRIDGYNDYAAELFELEELRAFVHELDSQFPFWLYFCNVNTSSLQMLAMCFLPPYLTPTGKKEHFPGALESLLMTRWIPALNQVAAFAQHPEAELREISDTAIGYFDKASGSLIY